MVQTKAVNISAIHISWINQTKAVDPTILVVIVPKLVEQLAAEIKAGRHIMPSKCAFNLLCSWCK